MLPCEGPLRTAKQPTVDGEENLNDLKTPKSWRLEYHRDVGGADFPPSTVPAWGASARTAITT